MVANGTGIVLPKFPTISPVDIEFSDLTYTVDDAMKKGCKTILNRVNGRFQPGHLTAIMGPSGAGKSTLMNITAGYRVSNVVGSIRVNGRERNLRKFRKMSCYIMQDDHLHPHLSVIESMNISANLKLGDKMTSAEKTDVVHEILESMGLTQSRDTRASDLSGGQRKRLSIALELVNNPPVMFFDEPTSGLDSSSSFHCIKVLKTLAQGGRTVVCTIHQPSATLFAKFDELYALSEGHCIYRGSTAELLGFLSAHGHECPAYHNPACFLIELASGGYGEVIQKMVSAANDSNSNSITAFYNGSALAEYHRSTDSVPSLYNTSSGGETKLTLPGSSQLSLLNNDGQKVEDIPSSFHTSFWDQFVILFKRTFLIIIRDGLLTKVRLGSHLFIGLLIGMLYFNIGGEANKVYENSGCHFFGLLFLMFTAMMPTILTFPLEMKIFTREHLNSWYSLKSYYLAKTMADMPFQVIYPLLYVVLVYFMTGQPLEVHRFFMFTTMCIMTSLVAQSLGLAIGAAMSIQGAVFLGPIATIPLLLFAGFFVTYSSIPVYLRVLYYASYARYGFEGTLLALYGFDREPLKCSALCLYQFPGDFLEQMDMRGAQYWLDVVILAAFFVLLRTFAYFVLRWKLKSER